MNRLLFLLSTVFVLSCGDNLTEPFDVVPAAPPEQQVEDIPEGDVEDDLPDGNVDEDIPEAPDAGPSRS